MPAHHTAVVIALAVALNLAVAQAGAAQSTDAYAADGAWVVHPMNWTLLVTGDDQILYGRIATQSGSFKRIWARYEYRSDQGRYPYAHRSAVYLEEVDCQQRRVRTLQANQYRQPNMQGGTVYSDAPNPPEWRYSLPDTYMDVVVDIACAL